MNYPSETLDFTGFKNGNFPIKDGFYRDGIFKTFVYKDIIQLVIQFNNDEKWWGYDIYNVNTKSLYAPYYDRGYGRHLVVEEIDKNIEKVFKKLIKAKVFKEKKDYGKESREV